MNAATIPYHILYYGERCAKELLFRCSMCGNCMLRFTGLICPMRCPKYLRNGPCGGSEDGRCETDRNKPCVWNLIYERNKFLHRLDKIQKLQPPLDWTLWHTPSWLNHFTGKDAYLFLPEEEQWKPPEKQTE